MSTPMDAAETGFGARLAGDAEIAGLLGTDAAGAVRVFNGWPHEVLERPAAPDFPRATFFALPERTIRPGVSRVPVQCDLWVWPDPDAGGGKAILAAIDARARALLDERWWIHDGHRLAATIGGPQGFNAAAGMPLRRRVPVEVLVSPA